MRTSRTWVGSASRLKPSSGGSPTDGHPDATDRRVHPAPTVLHLLRADLAGDDSRRGAPSPPHHRPAQPGALPGERRPREPPGVLEGVRRGARLPDAPTRRPPGHHLVKLRSSFARRSGPGLARRLTSSRPTFRETPRSSSDDSALRGAATSAVRPESVRPVPPVGRTQGLEGGGPEPRHRPPFDQGHVRPHPERPGGLARRDRAEALEDLR